MLPRVLVLPLFLLATPALSAEITCDGAFAADSSAERLAGIYGAANVVTGEIDGPEGSIILATTVFPDDPARRMVFGWWDEEGHRDLSYAELPDADSVAGMHDGLTVAEVEALNGEPFTMTGFWWDYGGYASFQSGKLAEIPGGCSLSVYFQPHANTPAGVDDTAVSGDVEVPSGEPLLQTLDVRVDAVTIGYPFPGLEEEGAEEGPAEDMRG